MLFVQHIILFTKKYILEFFQSPEIQYLYILNCLIKSKLQNYNIQY